MAKRIIYKNDDGGISVIIPAPDCGMAIEQIADKDVPPGVEYEIVDTDAIPSDRTFRDAWKYCPTVKVDICIDKAKSIAHDIRREKRAEEFAPLDERMVMRHLHSNKQMLILRQSQRWQERPVYLRKRLRIRGRLIRQ